MSRLTFTLNVEVVDGDKLRITSPECKCEVFSNRDTFAGDCADIAYSWADAESTVTALDSILNQPKE